MGRPYNTELASFPDTYRWALGLDIGPFATAIRSAANLPLVAIGSGGSLSAAQFCADWHQHATGRIARTLTPLETVAGRLGFGGIAGGVFSAGGRNADIRAAFRSMMNSEPLVSWVMTAAAKSPLVDAARVDSLSPSVFANNAPAGRDGFLATNTLLGFALQIHRAYTAAFPNESSNAQNLPKDWQAFAGRGPLLEGSADSVWGAQTLILLYGRTTRTAAIDLESKCTEAGLLNVQISDFRNFAHGRHHWLAKHRDSAVLALVTPEDELVANRTLAILPKDIPQAQLQVEVPGLLGGLRALVDVMRLVESIGRAKGIDPGRPGVPPFGGRLYSHRGIDLIEPPDRISPQPPRLFSAFNNSGQSRCAIERKLQRPYSSLGIDERHCWELAYNEARDHLTNARFAGVVLDFDGTLVDSSSRFGAPAAGITAILISLLEQGIALGIATGRGRSAGDALRSALPRSLWGQVNMGYYNGGEICGLDETDGPNRSTDVHETLRPILEDLQTSSVVLRCATLTQRRSQITIQPKDLSLVEELWDVAQGIQLRRGSTARLVRSSHSLDVLAPGVSKLELIAAVRRIANASENAVILRIGDQGIWPGNDAELLATLDGVSVNQVSRDPTSAWNFAPRGMRGAIATEQLLRCLRIDELEIRLVWPIDEFAPKSGGMSKSKRVRAQVTPIRISKKRR